MVWHSYVRSLTLILLYTGNSLVCLYRMLEGGGTRYILLSQRNLFANLSLPLLFYARQGDQISSVRQESSRNWRSHLWQKPICRAYAQNMSYVTENKFYLFHKENSRKDLNKTQL